MGGGFGGVTLAKKILNNSKEDFTITLIDKNDYQLFYPALFKAVSSFAEPSAIFSVAAIKFDDIFKNQEIVILKKEVVNILFDKNQVALKFSKDGKKILNYDYLVLAAGSWLDFADTETIKNHALTFKSFEDVLKIKTEIEYILKNKPKREDINIVVVGGGASGCILVSELYNYIHKLASLRGHPHQTINFKLVVKGKILPALSSRIRKKTRKSIEKMGIEILTDPHIDSLRNSADIFIWTEKVKPNSRFSLKTTRYLRAKGQKNVFVISDVVYQSAIHQAKYIADSLARTIKRKKIKLYRPIKDNICVAGLSGRLAGYIRRWGFLKYLKSILPLHKALDWLEKYKTL